MPFVTARVEVFPHDSIAGEPVDTEGLPFDKDFFKNAPVVIEHIDLSGDEVLSSPGEGHGRSYERVLGPEYPSVWHDRFGNPYTALVTKGNNFSKPGIRRHPVSPSGFLLYGLQEGDSLLRLNRASELMRQAGIDTEWLVQVDQPTHLYSDGEFITPAEYKSRLIQSTLGNVAALGTGFKKSTGQLISAQEEQANRQADAIRDMDFFITYRAMSTPYRVLDIVNDTYFNYTALVKVFEAYNHIASSRKEDLERLGLPQNLTVPTPKKTESKGTDIEKYLTDILPKLIALNMARLHNLGLIHDFPHLRNINALGGIVDLDSVKGPLVDLGDKESTQDDIVGDFHTLFSDGHFKEIIAGIVNYYKADYQTIEREFAHKFLLTYLQERDFGSGKDKDMEAASLIVRVAESSEWNIARELVRSMIEPELSVLLEEWARGAASEKLDTSLEGFSVYVYKKYIEGHEKDVIQAADLAKIPDGERALAVRRALKNFMAQQSLLVVGESLDWYNIESHNYPHEARYGRLFNKLHEVEALLELKLRNIGLKNLPAQAKMGIIINTIRPIMDSSVQEDILDFEAPKLTKTIDCFVEIFMSQINQPIVELYPA